MLILALDLSLNCSGYAVLQYNNGWIDIIEEGIINNKKVPTTLIGKKLKRIQDVLDDLFNRYQFQAVTREASFSNGRIKATQRLFMTLGVVYEDCHTHGYDELTEIAPSSVKKLVGGSGKSTKEDVAANLPYYVGYHTYKTDDVSDAVAVGIAYFMKQDLQIKLRYL